mmetsp:Transcript_17537/g.48956  ORF Transcript_17537/g.48956 Transcript_17537/m.48956 type:complete len:668 (-) Transcript_17537:469-2472(-)
MGNHITCLSKQQVLLQACISGNTVVVQELLQLRPELATAQLRNRGTRSTPLELAAANGHVVTLAAVHDAIVKLKGFELALEILSHLSILGYSPVMLACQARSSECVKFLLRSGASPWTVDATTGNTALHHAVISGSVQCINALLGHEHTSFPPHTMLVDSWGWARFPNLRNLSGLAALHLAAAKGDAGLVRVLLQGGASAELTVEDCYVIVPWCGRGSTALHLAASLGYQTVARALLDSSAQSGVDLLRIRNQQGFRAAHCAQLSQQREVAAMLTPEYDYSDNSHRLRRYARLMVQAASVQPWEGGVPLRVSLMLRLKAMRKKQLEGIAALENPAHEEAGAGSSTTAEGIIAESPAAAEDGSDGTETTTTSGGEGTAPEAYTSPGMVATAASADIAVAQAIVGAASISTRESLGLTLDIDSVYQALCIRDSSRMPGIMSTWLGDSDIEEGELPPDWQLQIACIALNCAATLSSGIGVNWFDQDSAARTSEILLQLGGKIMKASLWGPEDAAKQSEAPADSSSSGEQKDKDTMPTEMCEGEECAICMGDNVTGDTEIRPCGHRVCMACAFEIVCSSSSSELLCPFCRAHIKNIKLAGAEEDDDGGEEGTTEIAAADSKALETPSSAAAPDSSSGGASTSQGLGEPWATEGGVQPPEGHQGQQTVLWSS